MSTLSLMRAASLTMVAAVLAGCDQGATAPGKPSPQGAPHPAGLVTLEWQEQARSLVAAKRLNSLAGGRVYAALSVAQHRAVKDADAGLGTGGRSRAEARRGAVAGASAQVLGWFFPDSAAALEQKLVNQGGAGPGQVHPQFTRGVDVGRAAGDALIERVQNDGFTAPWTGTVPVGPGRWIPSALPPGGAVFGAVTPYFLTSGSQFRPAPPPEYGSAAFTTDLNEVLTLTQNITPEQLAFARYWDFPLGTPTPIGFWNGAAAGYVAQHRLDERGATQVFALMHAAMFDALIGCWEAKYHYWLLRPSQANPAIGLAFPVPNFPSYPSGHSCASSSAGRVLTHFFPNRAAEVANWVSDAGLSRILAGIHYRFDVTAGQALGKAVAELAIRRGAP
jgi:membrane-associated phospholipid phosphatase